MFEMSVCKNRNVELAGRSLKMRCLIDKLQHARWVPSNKQIDRCGSYNIVGRTCGKNVQTLTNSDVGCFANRVIVYSLRGTPIVACAIHISIRAALASKRADAPIIYLSPSQPFRLVLIVRISGGKCLPRPRGKCPQKQI